MLYEMASLRPPFMGKNMDKLYKKVCTGLYDPISSKFSDGLSSMIANLLKVKASERPSCNQILETKEFKDWEVKIWGKPKAQSAQGFGKLIDTIIVPRNLVDLKICLPDS